MTLLIPPIIPLITVLRPFKIPSLIPSNIFPPLEKTFLTAVHASEKRSLNQLTTLPNVLLIFSHIPVKNVDTEENASLTLL